MLQNSGYAVFNLFAPVLTYKQCHHHSIVYQLMGFMYFLMFEFVFYQRTYAASVGRDQLKSRMGIINYFVDIAEMEWDDFEKPIEEKMTQENHEEFIIAFYK